MNKTGSNSSSIARVLIAVCLLQLSACDSPERNSTSAVPSVTSTASITGTVTYRERIALPPSAVLEVQLLDTSLADVSSVLLGSQRNEITSVPPFTFNLEYSPEDIDPRYSYSVRADIRKDGQLLFTTDKHYPVLTRGAGESVHIVLIKVGEASRDPQRE